MAARNTPMTSCSENPQSSSKSQTWGEYWDSMTPDQLMEWYNQDDRTIKMLEERRAKREAAKKQKPIVEDGKTLDKL